MKHFVLTALVLVGMGAAAAIAGYRMSGDPVVTEALSRKEPLEWMRVEFGLNDEQLRRIKALRESYGAECEQHCRAIQLAARTKKRLLAAGAPADQIDAADRELQELRAFCEEAIAAHVRRCGAEMSVDARERYLSMVLPKIAAFDHQSAPNLHLGHPRS